MFPYPVRGEILRRSGRYIELANLQTDYENMATGDLGKPLSIKAGEDIFIVDMVEPKEAGQRLVHMGYFKNKNDGSIVLRAIDDKSGDEEFTREKALSADEVRELKDKGSKFDNSILYFYCAHLDPLWKDENVGGGQITLKGRNNK